MLVYSHVLGLVGGVTEVFQDQVNSVGDSSRNRFPKLHPAVHHYAAVPEVQDFQVLEVGEVGLQVWDKLRRNRERDSVIVLSIDNYLYC